jgi:hypothetical protein
MVATIESSAFENATELTTVSFPMGSNLTALGSSEATGIFKGTTKLDTVTIPNTLSTIGDNTFENSGIKKLVLTDTTAPSEIKEIGTSAFEGCARLTEFTYFDNVTSIGDRAFYCCSSMSNVTFGEQLTSIGAMAFVGCNNLATG